MKPAMCISVASVALVGGAHAGDMAEIGHSVASLATFVFSRVPVRTGVSSLDWGVCDRVCVLLRRVEPVMIDKRGVDIRFDRP